MPETATHDDPTTTADFEDDADDAPHNDDGIAGDGAPDAGEPDEDDPEPVADAAPSHADELLDEEVEAARRADAARAAADELHAEARLDESDGIPVADDPEEPVIEAHPLTVVTFDKVGNVIAGPVNAAQDGIDWEEPNAEAVGLIDPAPYRATAGAVAIGVYNLVTGEVGVFALHGDNVPPAVAREWRTLAATVPEVPPLHPDPDAFRAQLGAARAAEASAVPIVAEPEVAAPNVAPEPGTWRDAPEPVSAPPPADAPPPEPLTPDQHADVAYAHWNALHAGGPVAIDIAATGQGIAIAGAAARERRQQHPHSIPEASVAAVEGLGGTFRGLRRLIACYRHLAHAAAGGVDVGEALAALDAVADPLVPEL